MNGIFSMQGRYNRAKYFWILLLNIVPFIVFGLEYLILLTASYSSNPIPAWWDWLANERILFGIPSLCFIPISVAVAFASVKRLHDIGRPGEHYWLLVFIPFYSWYLFFVLLFKKGDEGPNKYGPDPLDVTSIPSRASYIPVSPSPASDRVVSRLPASPVPVFPAIVLEELFQDAKDVWNAGNRRGGIALLNQVLKRDIHHSGVWNFLHSQFGQGETLEEFQIAYIQKFFPNQKTNF
jgi:uncharacterized membrane protein YhaH (DUF805 family)